jgi:hypothetical protein
MELLTHKIKELERESSDIKAKYLKYKSYWAKSIKTRRDSMNPNQPPFGDM